MKIEKITVKNFKAIDFITEELNGKSILVTGSNGEGKSSFIDSVFKILTGNDLPSKLVKEGKENGSVKIDLGEVIVNASFNSLTEKVNLSVETKEGARFSSPRKMLDEMVGIIDFDINEFLKLPPKKKSLEIQKMVGIDFTDQDDEYKKIFEERTIVNRKVSELETKLKERGGYDKNLVKVDVEELRQKLSEANKTNSNVSDVRYRMNERTEKIMNLSKRHEALTKEIEEIEKEKQDLGIKNTQAEKWIKEHPLVSTDEIDIEFENAIKHNEKCALNERSLELKNDFEAALKYQDKFNSQLKEIEDLKKRAFADCKLPVSGLTFDENGLYLNGLPFESNQINTSELIKAGLQIQMAMIGKVRIARFDGSLLDNENLKAVESWAKENDMQLFIELVERDKSGLKIEVLEA